jgi:hypothetical protein
VISIALGAYVQEHMNRTWEAASMGGASTALAAGQAPPPPPAPVG